MHINEYINLISEGNWFLLLKNLISPMLIGVYLTAIGLAVLSLINRSRADWIDALAPFVGFASLVMLLSNIGLLIGVRNRGLFGFLFLFTSAVIIHRRVVVLEILKRWLVPWLIGMACVLFLGLLPLISVSNGRVLNHASTNHDAIYYASNQNWVAANPYSQRPQIFENNPNASDTPAASSAVVASDFHVRQGEGLASAFLNTWPRFDTSTNWFNSHTAWLWLGFVSVLGASSLLQLSKRKSLLIAVATATSWQTIFQMYNQNAPAIIGLSLLPLSLSLGLAFRSEKQNRFLVIFASILLFVVLITTYGELLPFAGTGFMLCAIDRKLFTRKKMLSLVIIASASLLAAPYASYQAVRTVLRVSGLTNALGTPQFWARPVLDLCADIVGLPSEVSGRNQIALLLIIFLLLGLILFCYQRRTLGPLLFVLLTLCIWVQLGRTGAYYSVDRLVQTTTSTFIWVGIVGVILLLNKWTATRVAALSGVLMVILVNALAPLQYLRSSGNLDWRTFPSNLLEITDLARVSANNGEQLMIATNNYIDRLWISNDLFSAPATEYSFLTPDYFYILTHFDDRAPDRYLLSNIRPVGNELKVLETSDSYQLFDLQNRSASLLVPSRQDIGQDSFGTLSGGGVSEFRILTWGLSSHVEVKLRIEGLGSSVAATIDSSKVVLPLRDGALSLKLSPGTHDVQLIGANGLASPNWAVTLTTIDALE